MKHTANRKRLFLSTALPAIMALGIISTLPEPSVAAPASDKAPTVSWSDYPSMFDAFLFGKVDPKEGNVDYLALKGDKKLDRFIEAVGSVDLSTFPTWTIKDEKGKETVDRSIEVVFWINAFNAHVLKTIADAYPIESPSQIKNYWTAKTHKVAGTDYSLADMRDKLAKMDPRTLFAMIDGTRSGPMLAPFAYRYFGISGLLDATVSAFVNREGNVNLDRTHNSVVLNGFFSQADPYFKSKSARRKWDGIRYILATYVKQRVEKGYFTTSDYTIDFQPGDDKVNNKSLSGIAAN